MNRRERRARGIRGRVVDVEPVRLVVEYASLRGCLCDPPGVRFSGPLRYGEMSVVQIEHDPGCSLLLDHGIPMLFVPYQPDDGGES